MPPTRYVYHTEPVASTALIVVVLVICALLLPIPLLRILLTATAAGPIGWIFFQLLRRGRSIYIDAAHILIQDSLPRRTRTIPFIRVRGHTATRRGGLAILYELPKVDPPADPSPYAVSNARPESHNRLRHRLIVTPAVDGIGHAIAQISAELTTAGYSETFSADDMMTLLGRLRLRNTVLVILAVLATPLYVIVVARTIGSFR